MLGVLLLLYLIEKFPISIMHVWEISCKIENQFPFATKVLELSSFIVKALIGYGESDQRLFNHFNVQGELYQSFFIQAGALVLKYFWWYISGVGIQSMNKSGQGQGQGGQG